MPTRPRTPTASCPIDHPVHRRQALLALALAATAAPLRAQGFPSRAIRVVVPWPPGGLVDTGGRAVGDALTKAFGQPVSVENVPGAAGTLGAGQVAKADADGHTLLMATSSLAIDVAGARSMPFDPRRDLAPVALVADTHSIVVVPAASPHRTLADLLAAARAKPGDLSYGTPGVGSPAHLFNELLAQSAGLKLLHVPYGRSPAMTDLIGGRLSLMVATAPSALPQVRNGQLRALAVTSAQRLPGLPDVPTVAEAGLPGYDSTGWFGVVAPVGTPDAIVAKLNAEITAALNDEQIKTTMRNAGVEPAPGTSAAFDAYIRAETTKWSRVIRQAGIKLDL